jgi:hypothetical protein
VITAFLAAALAAQPISCPLDALTSEQRALTGERLGKLIADLPGGESDPTKLAAAAYDRAMAECSAKLGWSREQSDAAMQHGSAQMVLDRLRSVYAERKIDLTRLDPVVDRLFAAPESGAGAAMFEGMENVLRAQGMMQAGDDPKALVLLYARLRDLVRRAEADFASAG